MTSFPLTIIVGNSTPIIIFTPIYYIYDPLQIAEMFNNLFKSTVRATNFPLGTYSCEILVHSIWWLKVLTYM